MALKEEKNHLWLICTEEITGFILPVFAHPDQQLIAEVLTISAVLHGELSKINSCPQPIEPAVPLHTAELPLPLLCSAAVVPELLGPLWEQRWEQRLLPAG